MINCSRPNSGTVSRIQFKLAIYALAHLKIAITQYWVVLSSSYFLTRGRPQRAWRKMVAVETAVAYSNGSTKSAFYGLIF